MEKMRIDVWADVTCPFCLFGELMLANVLTGLRYSDEIEVCWNSCLLHPNWNMGEVQTWEETMDAMSLEARLEFERKTHLLRSLAQRLGVEYNLEQALSLNSTDAARLLKWATEYDRVLELAQLFGEGYFSHAANLSDHEVLLTLVEACDLPMDEAKQILAGDRYLDEVRQDQLLAQVYAPEYVPTFYFNGKYPLSGLVTEEQIRKNIEQAFEEWSMSH